MIVRPLLRKSAEHRKQVLVALHHDDPGDHGERNAGDRQPGGPEDQPIVHAASFNVDSGLAPVEDGGARLPIREPRMSPRAARPNAQKPVMFSLQCRKKKGMIAPAAPISMAR